MTWDEWLSQKKGINQYINNPFLDSQPF
jgi:hypothetical protein